MPHDITKGIRSQEAANRMLNHAMELILESYLDRLYSFCIKRIPYYARDKAEDIIQETMIGIRQNMLSFRGQEGAESVAPWVFSICRNQLNVSLRSLERMPEMLPDNYEEQSGSFQLSQEEEIVEKEEKEKRMRY